MSNTTKTRDFVLDGELNDGDDRFYIIYSCHARAWEFLRSNAMALRLIESEKAALVKTENVRAFAAVSDVFGFKIDWSHADAIAGEE